MEHFDCIILGAGISGIDAAYHLKTFSPTCTFANLERRANIGGTWDFFKYPGIRSDSDMFTFGFSFKPWSSAKTIAPASDIIEYLEETVDEFQIREHIHFNTHVVKADWESQAARWSLQTEQGKHYSCNFLLACGGYYLYDEPYLPDFPGRDRFRGRMVHPQMWSTADDAFYPGKRVAIIGSGATAVTLLPNLVKGGAAHVTMVQRTPTYIVAAPEEDFFHKLASKVLPAGAAHAFVRYTFILRFVALYNFMKTYPKTAKKLLLAGAWRELQGTMSKEEFDKNFIPPYNPWDQRLCLAPAGDLYQSIRDGNASVATGTIETFTETGIQLHTGEHVDADMIIAATGLTMQRNFPMSTMHVTIDGVPYNGSEKMVYKGMMLSGVPNFAFTVGYTSASWTLKSGLTSAYTSRLINYMRSHNYATCCPQLDSSVETDQDFLTLSSGYVARARQNMPNQGKKAPWRLHDNYIKDHMALAWGKLEDPSMAFGPIPSRL